MALSRRRLNLDAFRSAAVIAFEKIPYVWPMHGIIVLLRNGQEFALGCFCDNEAHQFPALWTRKRTRPYGHGDARA
jgi:hypothetical protein